MHCPRLGAAADVALEPPQQGLNREQKNVTHCNRLSSLVVVVWGGGGCHIIEEGLHGSRGGRPAEGVCVCVCVRARSGVEREVQTISLPWYVNELVCTTKPSAAILLGVGGRGGGAGRWIQMQVASLSPRGRCISAAHQDASRKQACRHKQ